MSIDLTQVISNISALIMLLLPAIIFQIFFQLNMRELSKKISLLTFIGSFLLSFPFQLFPSDGIHLWIKNGLIILASATSGFIARKLASTSFIKDKIFSRKLHQEIDLNPWNGIGDLDYGCYITVFLKESNLVYTGAYYKSYLDDDNTSWIILSNFAVYRFSEENLFDDSPIVSYEHNSERQTMINTKNILSVHILYNEKSSKIQLVSKK